MYPFITGIYYLLPELDIRKCGYKRSGASLYISLVWLFLGIYLGVIWKFYVERFKQLPDWFPQQLNHFTNLPTKKWGLWFLHILANMVLLSHFIYCVYIHDAGTCMMHACACKCTCARVHMWRSEDNSWESILSFHHGSQAWALILRLAWQVFLTTEPPYQPIIVC